MSSSSHILINRPADPSRFATGQVAGISPCEAVTGTFAHLKAPRISHPVNIMGRPSAAGFPRSPIAARRRLALATGLGAAEKLGDDEGVNYFAVMLDNEKDDDDTPRENKDYKAVLALEKGIIKLLANFIKKHSGCSSRKASSEAKALFNTSSKDVLNNLDWNTVEDSFRFRGTHFNSTLIPAGQIKLGDQDIFAAGYANKGISSKSNEETTHAMNMWISTFYAGDDNRDPLFSGIRHGVLSPFGLKAGSAERQQGALNRAREVAAAALFLHPEKLAAALAGQTVVLPLTSTSLLTPVDIGPSTEESQFRDQMEAWEKLGAGPVEIPIRNEKGEMVRVTLRLDIAAFNFGVNELALKRLHLGHNTAGAYNRSALVKLLGKDLSPGSAHGGWVGQYLASRPDNADRVSSLASELKQIWAKKTYRADKGEPYKAAVRVALLSHEIGITPCWNCKSGKDRTGIMDAVIKHQAVSQYLRKTDADSVLPDAENKTLMQKVMLNSGNMQIQQHNAGVPGNKCLKNNKIFNFLFGKLTLRRSIGDKRIADQAEGFSKYV
ncbi:inositol phosphate phosphatase SopB [Sodalis sp. RH19]|uniref:inositol phosphate phosphatase SopB n=1 Tax=Sodalis sp. RH19 TaxID=3394334 RepID=UPI0039B6B461